MLKRESPVPQLEGTSERRGFLMTKPIEYERKGKRGGNDISKGRAIKKREKRGARARFRRERMHLRLKHVFSIPRKHAVLTGVHSLPRKNWDLSYFGNSRPHTKDRAQHANARIDFELSSTERGKNQGEGSPFNLRRYLEGYKLPRADHQEVERAFANGLEEVKCWEWEIRRFGKKKKGRGAH